MGIELAADPYAACAGAAALVVLTEWDEFKWLDLDKVVDCLLSDDWEIEPVDAVTLSLRNDDVDPRCHSTPSLLGASDCVQNKAAGCVNQLDVRLPDHRR